MSRTNCLCVQSDFGMGSLNMHEDRCCHDSIQMMTGFTEIHSRYTKRGQLWKTVQKDVYELLRIITVCTYVTLNLNVYRFFFS